MNGTPPALIRRDQHGIAHVEADSEADLYWGQGFAHATDRGLQILLMRILGQGRVSEVLDSSGESLEVDLFFRRMNWSGRTKDQLDVLSEQARHALECYCRGVNAALARKYPWEFRLLGYRPEPWRPEDTLTIVRMIGYLTLQQSQAEMERLIVEMVQAGVSAERLEELFPGRLGGLDLGLVKQVRLSQRIVPGSVLWGTAAPRMMASNNWAVSGRKTTSGKPILASDPHLEGNRLPSVWYEIVLQSQNRYLIGGSIPGVPGVVIGRNPDVAWSATYAFMDAVDSWIEHCQGGKYHREPNEWLPFRERKETILRRRKPQVEVTFYENEHGVLDGDPYQDGFFLATRWAAGQSGGQTWSHFQKMWSVTSVEEGMDALGRVESAWNFVLADRHGNIGYQMSGLMPERREGVSGLVPLPGWKTENDWRSFVSHRDLPRVINPEQGFFATANQDLNRFGNAQPSNLPMGPYRADRINELLETGNRLTVSDMFRMHFDVYSPQAELFMKILKPLLPSSAQGEILRNWDYRYDAESQGAYLFEQFYRRLCREVFGKGGLGEDVVGHLAEETGVFVDFYVNFDRVLLSQESTWFGGQSRDEVFRKAATESLAVKPRTWGESQRYLMRHLLLGGKLPKFLGFDRGPIVAIGGRGTIHQGQVYRSGNRTTTFVPSFRFVTDMANDECHTNLEGGPSDRRFSQWYCSELENWYSGRYKAVEPEGTQKMRPFR
ncbi:MAG: penicillin acylase family protein [Pirellulaceae bacterium]